MGIYFFHYPIMILMNGLMIPEYSAADECLGVVRSVSCRLVLILGCPLPVDWVYTNVMGLITSHSFLNVRRRVEDEGLEDEYDSEEEDRFAKYWLSVEWLLKSWLPQ
ncbi:MAG: hypothetical protein ACLUTU_05885 [Blautia faecis]